MTPDGDATSTDPGPPPAADRATASHPSSSPSSDLSADLLPPLDLRAADDATVLAAHVAGDPDAFGEIFRRHKDRMWAVALRTCGDRELSSDCVQDAFVAAFRRAGSFRGEAAVTTWLHRIVVNACLDRLRRRRPTSTLPEEDLADGRDEHRSTEVALDVREALARLPEGQRLALVLVDMQGLSVADAAAVLDVAEGTVKSRCARGRATMAELLGLVRRADGRLVERGDGPADLRATTSGEPSAGP